MMLTRIAFTLATIVLLAACGKESSDGAGIAGPGKAAAAPEPLSIREDDGARPESVPKPDSGADARRPGDAEFAAGMEAFNMRDFPSALAKFEAAISLDGARSEFWHWRGRAAGRVAEYAPLLQQPGWAKKAIEGFEKGAEFDAKNFEARRDVLNFSMMAPGFMGGGRDKAIAQAEAMSALSEADGRRAWGRIAFYDKDYAKAEAEFTAAAAANPADAEIPIDFGLSYQAEKRYAEARAQFRKALENDPTIAEARFRLGETAALSGEELDEAEKALRDYLAGEIAGNDPSPAEARMMLGKVLAHKGDRGAARAELETAVALNPNLKLAQKALEGLQ